MTDFPLTISIVSHGHGTMLPPLLKQLAHFPNLISHVILTQNIKETCRVSPRDVPFRITLLENKSPKGYGENHNQAFQYCRSKVYCILNPDICFLENPFHSLLETLNHNPSAILAPTILTPDHDIEDNARHFPTPWDIVKKAAGRYTGIYPRSRNQDISHPDWVAGMFLFMAANTYSGLKGFDEDYFLYYEDVDLCARAWKTQRPVILCQSPRVIHNARRDSHRKINFLNWHLQSLLRYFFKHPDIALLGEKRQKPIISSISDSG